MADDVTTKILQIQVDYGDSVKKMAEYRQQIETIKKQQADWKKSLKDGAISQEEYARSMEASKLQIGQYNQAISTIQKTVVNQMKQQKEQEGSLVSLRAELSNLTAEYDRLSREDRESEIGTNLKNQINKVTTELKACEEGTQRFFRNVGNYKSAFAAAGVGTTELTDALTKECKTADEAAKANAVLQKAIDAIDPSADGAQESIDTLNKKIEENQKVIDEHEEASNGLIDAMSQLTGVNLNFGKSLESLSKNSAGSIMDGLNTKAKALWQTLTGLLANPYVLAFLGIAGVGMAFKWWYEYNEGLVEASKATKRFTGMSGDDMRAYRDEVQAVCDVFGADFNDVLGTADTLVAQYGMSWNEALETIEQGFESGANANGDMLAQMQQMPAQFSAIGLSAKEMTALISQTTSGIWGKDGMAAIEMSGKKIREMKDTTASALDAIGISSKQVTKDLNDGTKSTFDVMQEVASKLKEMPESSQAVGVVLKEVFGEQGVKAGKKQIETLADINLNLDECVAATGRVGESQAQMVEAQTELNNALAALFDTTGGSFESMKASAKLWVTQGLTAMVKGIIGVCNYLIDLYNNSLVVRAGVAGICAGFKMSWSIIKNVCGMIADEVMGLGKIIKGVLTLSWDDVAAGWEQFRKASTKAVKNIAKDYVDNVGDAIDETLNGKLEHIKENLDVTGAADQSNGSPKSTNQQAVDMPKKGGSKSSKSSDNNKAADDAKKAKDAEIQYLRKAEDELMKITIQSLEQRRKTVELSYTRQIEDYQRKLETDKTLTEASRTAILSIIDSLGKQKEKALAEFDAEELKKTIDQNQKLIEVKLKAVVEGSEQEYKLKLEQMNNNEQLAILAAEKEIENETEKQEMLKAIREQYAYERKVLEESHQTEIIEQQKQALQNEIDNLTYAQSERELRQMEGYQMNEEHYAEWRRRGLEEMDAHEREILLKQEEAAAAELEALINRGQLATQTTAEYEAEILSAKKKSADAQKATNETIIKNEQAKANAMKAITGGLTQLLDTLGESNKAFAKMSKIITLAQIAIDTGKALASGIASASSMPFPSNIAAIATTVATVLANVATAISTVKSAKFAKGGKVTGPGTGTSDSIPAMLSNGEYVMTAAATQLFEPLLMTMNNIGRGVPMQVLNSSRDISQAEMLADSFESAAREIKPVVSVVEITEAQDRVTMIENLDTY